MRHLPQPRKFDTIEDVVTFILADAEDKSWWRWLRSDLPSGDQNDPRVLKDNAMNVGKIIEALPPEARELLKGLSAEDLAKKIFFGWKEEHARPKVPPRQRIRGPVSFGDKRD